MKAAMLLLTLSAALAACPVPAVAQGQGSAAITVYLINARTGRPIPHKPVSMASMDPRSGRFWHWEGKTDRRGTVVFHMMPPFPSKVDIRLNIGGYWVACTPPQLYDVPEILTSGASVMGPCLFNIQNLDRQFHPKPGEVYSFAVHLTFWEHLTHCGEWGCTGSPAPTAPPPAKEAPAHSISVLVVNGRTAKPIAGKYILIYTVRAHPDPTTGYPYRQTELRTDSEGKAVFGFDNPELRIFVIPEFKGSRACSAEKFDPREVLRSGVVASNRCDPSGKVRASFTPKPGQLVVFDRLPRF
jgi:hypothetical protein